MNFMHSVLTPLRTDEPDGSILVAEFCERSHLLVIKCIEHGFFSLKKLIYPDVRPLVQLGCGQIGVFDFLQFEPGLVMAVAVVVWRRITFWGGVGVSLVSQRISESEARCSLYLPVSNR